METQPEAHRYIYEYTVPIGGAETQLLLDEHAEILHVAVQYDASFLEEAVVFWAYCVDGAPTKPRTFRVIGTGWDVPDGAVHCGTAIQGYYVWHLMEMEATE